MLFYAAIDYNREKIGIPKVWNIAATPLLKTFVCWVGALFV